jgi:hypothetical protein
MSQDLVVLNSNQALAQGGLGLDSRLFKLKPATLELVQSTTKQEGAIPGKLRVTATNEHFEEMKVVMLVPPIEQRAKYKKGKDFSRDAKECFSLDNVQPHAKAKNPPALYCATCPAGDINWEKWRKTKDPADLPSCSKYWHLALADRTTQMIYYFNVKGTSITYFEQAMQNLARLINQMEMNVRAENKQLKAAYDKAVAETPADGQKPEAPVYKPMPNIFDITFTIYPVKSKDDVFVVNFKNFLALRPEDRSEFGALYLDFVTRKAQGNVATAEESEAEAAAANAAVTGPPSASAPAAKEVDAVIGKSTVIEGEIVGKDPITI